MYNIIKETYMNSEKKKDIFFGFLHKRSSTNVILLRKVAIKRQRHNAHNGNS